MVLNHMVQMNYKQGPPAVLSNKTQQDGNCLELDHRGHISSGTIKHREEQLPKTSLLHTDPRRSQQARGMNSDTMRNTAELQKKGFPDNCSWLSSPTPPKIWKKGESILVSTMHPGVHGAHW